MASDPTIPNPEGVPPASVAETFLGLGSTGWLAVAFVLFVLLLWRVGAFAALVKALDSQADKVRAALAEAEALKAEAERLRKAAAEEAEAAARQAAAIVERAEADAARVVAEAAAEAQAAVARRTRLAEERIEAAGRAAEAELRAHAATLARQAATRILVQEAEAGRLRHLTDAAIADLGRV
jgi:F-type H+-transporting ATPase subunit b